MAHRPFRRESIVELERRFRDGQDDRQILEALSEELTARTTQRARSLAERVRQLLEGLRSPPMEAADIENALDPYNQDQPETQAPEPGQASEEPEAPDRPDAAHHDDSVAGTLLPEADSNASAPASDPSAILELWTALEVLSPQTFVRPEDLADGELRQSRSSEMDEPCRGSAALRARGRARSSTIRSFSVPYRWRRRAPSC